MDGALGEEAWKAAPVFDAFIQSYPQEGAAPSERTERYAVMTRGTDAPPLFAR